MSKVYCEFCKDDTEYSCEIVKLFEKVNDVPIAYKYIITRCIKCKNEIFVKEIAEGNGKAKKEAYYRRKFELNIKDCQE